MRITTSYRHWLSALKRTIIPPSPEPPPGTPEETLRAVLHKGMVIGAKRERERLLPQATIYNACEVCGKPLVGMIFEGVPFLRCPDNEDSRHHSGPIPRITPPPAHSERKVVRTNPIRVYGNIREIKTRQNMMVARLLNMKARDQLPSPRHPSKVTQDTIIVPAVKVVEVPPDPVEERPSLHQQITMPSWSRATGTSALEELADLAETAKLGAVKMRERVQARYQTHPNLAQ